jgi:hypothetical protein
MLSWADVRLLFEEGVDVEGGKSAYFFRCHLCLYGTGSNKTIFQHIREDKHREKILLERLAK